MNAMDATLDLSTVIVMLIAAISWAGSLCAIYFSLRGQLNGMDMRMNNFSTRLDDGSSKFSLLEANHIEHGTRLVYLETIVGQVNDKLGIILLAVQK